VQLFAPPTNPARKIPFINPDKPFNGCQQSAHKYYGLVGLGLGLGLVLLCRLGLVLRLQSVWFDCLVEVVRLRNVSPSGE